MRVFVALNQVAEVGFRQTTGLLIAALVRQNHEVWLADVNAFSIAAYDGPANIIANAFRLPFSADCSSQLVDAFTKSKTATSRQTIAPGDAILIRTNPGRDVMRSQLHESFLHLCVAAQSSGVRVINSPGHLRYFASKSSLVDVDAPFRPAMVVTSDVRQIQEFVNQAPADCVVKPLFGSRGENVIRVSKSNTNLAESIESTFGATTLVVQQFVNADHVGDKRVVVFAGQVLEINGHLAGIERHPACNDFRANLHAGGSAHPLTLPDSARAAAEYAARLLNDHGILLAGVDLIGDRIIEFNVFSTGGLYDSIQFSGVRFDDAIVERLFA